MLILSSSISFAQSTTNNELSKTFNRSLEIIDISCKGKNGLKLNMIEKLGEEEFIVNTKFFYVEKKFNLEIYMPSTNDIFPNDFLMTDDSGQNRYHMDLLHLDWEKEGAQTVPGWIRTRGLFNSWEKVTNVICDIELIAKI